MSRKYCNACGEQKRLTWPRDEPQCCTKECAARWWLLAVRDGAEGHCGFCGELKHGDHDEIKCAEGGEG